MSFPIAMNIIGMLTGGTYGVYLDDQCLCSGFASRADAREWAVDRGFPTAKVKLQ